MSKSVEMRILSEILISTNNGSGFWKINFKKNGANEPKELEWENSIFVVRKVFAFTIFNQIVSLVTEIHHCIATSLCLHYAYYKADRTYITVF